MTTVPTVKVKNPAEPGEFMIINQSDFDPDVHELYDPEATAEDAPADESAEAEAPAQKAPKSRKRSK